MFIYWFWYCTVYSISPAIPLTNMLALCADDYIADDTVSAQFEWRHLSYHEAPANHKCQGCSYQILVLTVRLYSHRTAVKWLNIFMGVSTLLCLLGVISLWSSLLSHCECMIAFGANSCGFDPCYRRLPHRRLMWEGSLCLFGRRHLTRYVYLSLSLTIACNRFPCRLCLPVVRIWAGRESSHPGLPGRQCWPSFLHNTRSPWSLQQCEPMFYPLYSDPCCASIFLFSSILFLWWSSVSLFYCHNIQDFGEKCKEVTNDCQSVASWQWLCDIEHNHPSTPIPLGFASYVPSGTVIKKLFLTKNG